MAVEIFMPRLGLTMKEGTIVVWLKDVGDYVKKGEPVVEITSEKITNVIEAPDSGILAKILFLEGDTVPSGTVIAYLEDTADAGKQEENRTALGQKDKVEEDKDIKIRRVIELAGARKVIAQRMEESLRRSPQASVTSRADLTALMELKESLAREGYKYTVTDFFVKIVALALEKNPILNSSLQDGKIFIYESLNIGIAMALEESLIVPVIYNVEQKNLQQISAELRELTSKARDGSLASVDMTGGTFTLSNLGIFNVDVMTPILNPPEAALLAIGTVRKEPVISADDSISVRQGATLSLTIDHAVTDGVPAARFLETIHQILREPRKYLCQ